MDELEMGWQELRQRILDAHKPIQDLFFTGIGNKLQFKDSCVAESVMLQFAYIALCAPQSSLFHTSNHYWKQMTNHRAGL